MKRLLISLLSITSLSLSAAEPIFNGKDLTGWKVQCLQRDMEKTYWSVQDNAITVDTKGDKNHDYVWLTYDEEIADFELTLKIRSIRKTIGNSGIQIRSRYTELPADSEKSHYLNGPQIDIHPPTPYRVGLVYDETIGVQRWIYPNLKNWGIQESDANKHSWIWQSLNDDGSYSTLVSDEKTQPLSPLSDAEVKNGWNLLKIRAQGDVIQTWVNGHLVTYFEGTTDLNTPFHKKYNVGSTGKISLQLHSGDDLGLQFKDITLDKLQTNAK